MLDVTIAPTVSEIVSAKVTPPIVIASASSVPSISASPLISKVAASISPLMVIFLPPVISLFASVMIALLAITVPFVIPSIRLMSAALAVTPSKILSSAAVDVTPSRIFSSAAVDVTPSKILSSAAVDVTPSRIFNSAAVEVTAVPFMDNASVSSVPSISTSPDISSAVATISLLNIALPAALPSSVKKVVSTPPSVPLNIMSVSFAAASIVISPELVVMVTAASPA